MTNEELITLVETIQDAVKKEMAPLPFTKNTRGALLDGHKQGMWNVINELTKMGILTIEGRK